MSEVWSVDVKPADGHCRNDWEIWGWDEKVSVTDGKGWVNDNVCNIEENINGAIQY